MILKDIPELIYIPDDKRPWNARVSRIIFAGIDISEYLQSYSISVNTKNDLIAVATLNVFVKLTVQSGNNKDDNA